MKYLMLVMVLGAGYGVYTYGPETMATFHRVQAQVETAMGKTKALAQRQGPPVIPGQSEPAAAGQSFLNAPPVMAAGQKSADAPPFGTADSFKGRLAASQRSAVQKYPALGQAKSEMNSRFLFRYKNLVTDKSARLQDANWPLLLADECAAAMVEAKAKAKTVPATSRKGTLASVEAAH